MKKVIILSVIIGFFSILQSFGQEKLVIRKRINNHAFYVNYGKKITAEMRNEECYKGRLTGVNSDYLTIETRRDGSINLIADSINSLYVFRYHRLALYIGELIAQSIIPVIILTKLFKQEPVNNDFWILYSTMYITSDYIIDYTISPVMEFNWKKYRINAP